MSESTKQPLHLLFAWNPEFRLDTMEAHQTVDASAGSVWWGRFNRKGSPRAAPGTKHIPRLRAQLEAGIPTWVFFRHTSRAHGLTPVGRSDWAARLLEITDDPTAVDSARLPGYYAATDCNLFVRVTGWTDLGEGWVLRNLDLANTRLTLDERSLGNQTNPNLVVLHGSPESDSEVAEAEESVASAAGKARGGQGRGLTPAQRDAVEMYAMARAKAHYERLWPRVEDTSIGNPYDLHCSSPHGGELYVEVKGTTTTGASVLVTPGEVRRMRAEHPNTALFIVHSVVLTEGASGPACSAGDHRELSPWDLADAHLESTGFAYKVPPI